MKKYLIFTLTIIFIILLTPFAITEDKYVPSPIIFVHGFGAGDWGSWDTARNELKKYFIDEDGNLKYPYEKPKYGYGDGGTEYFPYLNFPGNGSIPTISGSYLGPAVINGLSSIPDCDSSEKKVIIIAHSFGGLAAKSLLKRSSNWDDKISKIIFVDTPHKGSPYASMIWVLKEVTDNKLPPLIRDHLNYSTPSGTIKSSLGSSDKENIAHFRLVTKLAAEKRAIDRDILLLGLPCPVNINARGKAIEEMRLPTDVSYYKLFEGECDEVKVSEPVSKISDGSTTFLGHENDYLRMPNPAKTETFIGVSQQDNFEHDWEEILLEAIEAKYIPSLTFPLGESLEDVKNSGDGIVSLFSQRNGGTNADFNFSAFHTKATEVAADTILLALDDPPVIENVRFIKTGEAITIQPPPEAQSPPYTLTPWYLIFKVKDYLLADIEISDFGCMYSYTNYSIVSKYSTVYSSLTSLTEFYDSETGKYKPYVKFGKDFLKERDDKNAPIIDENGNTTYLHLEPGEFCIRVLYFPTGYYIKFKNPAQKEADGVILQYWLPSSGRDFSIARKGGASGTTEKNSGLTYSAVREQAYSNLLSAQKEFFQPNLSTYTLYIGVTASGTSWTYEKDVWNNEEGKYEKRTYSYFVAGISANYGYCCNFNVNIEDKNKKVRLVVANGYVDKTYPPQCFTIGPDCKILVLKDTSNIWPPTFDSSGNELIFSINTANYTSNDDEFTFELNPEIINPNGNNIWRIKQDYLDYNAIPNEKEDGYRRQIYIGLGLTIVVY